MLQALSVDILLIFQQVCLSKLVRTVPSVTFKALNSVAMIYVYLYLLLNVICVRLVVAHQYHVFLLSIHLHREL